MQHTYLTAADCTCGDTDSCFVCRQIVSGGLAVCKVCGGGEGSLTTHCCGRKMTETEESRVYYSGTLDFRDGLWVNLPNPTNQRFQNDPKG